MTTKPDVAIPHRVLPSASLIDSPEAVAGALCAYFLANADRGDHAANDELVRRVVVTLDATMNTATVLTRPEAVEIARAMLAAAT